MCVISRNFGWLAGAPLILGLVAEVSAATDFHHTKWTSENGLGAVFDIQQSPDGYPLAHHITGGPPFRRGAVPIDLGSDLWRGGSNEIDSVFLPVFRWPLALD